MTIEELYISGERIDGYSPWHTLACNVMEVVYVSDLEKLYFELHNLSTTAKNILKDYKQARSRRKKSLLIERYLSLCAQIKKIKNEIDKVNSQTSNYLNSIDVKKYFKIAAYFKKLIGYITRNLRSFFRQIIRFLFKNMDDNSADNYFFLPDLMEKNNSNQNYHLYERESIPRINSQNR